MTWGGCFSTTRELNENRSEATFPHLFQMNHASFNWFDIWESSVFFPCVCTFESELAEGAQVFPGVLGLVPRSASTPALASRSLRAAAHTWKRQAARIPTITWPQKVIKVHLYSNNPILLTTTDVCAPAVAIVAKLQHSNQFKSPDESTSWYLVKKWMFRGHELCPH